MNDERLRECGTHVGELGFPTLLLPLNPTSIPHITSMDITNVAQDMIPATSSFSPTPCLHNCPIPYAFLLCTLAVNIPDNLAPYMDCAPLIPLDIHFTKSLGENLVPTFYAARLNDVSITQTIQHKNSNGEQCDIGANICATADKSLLLDFMPLGTPLNLLGADATVTGMLCPGYGFYPMMFTDGTVAHIHMYYCPQLSETLISPQHICIQNSNSFAGFDIQCRDMDNAYVRFYQSPDFSSFSDAPLTRKNNLFYFTQLSLHPQANRLSPLLNTELWHQRLGHPGMHQLRHLQKCTTGIPSGLHQQVHPLHHCKICSDARARKNPMGPTTSVEHLLPGSRFHLDFGFMRASSQSYVKITGATRVVNSYDGYNSYLLITDAKTRYTWVFLTATKEPPTQVVNTFLNTNGLKTGYRALRIDQGGELWRSDTLRHITATAGYVMEPTGSDSPHQNGKVERLNGTFGVMVRSLLYSSGLPPQYWSAALVHSVHLKNRLWHSALDVTPFEAWNGTQPDVSHLRVFGSLLTAKIPGHRPAKLDKHTYDGIFLGYEGSSSKNVMYLDVHSGRVKVGGNFNFDEAHYTSTLRPPGPQFLFDLGLHTAIPAYPNGTDPLSHTAYAPFPPFPGNCIMKPLPALACLLPLPLGELTTHTQLQNPNFPAAAAALNAPEVMSIELSGNPFGPSFIESIPLSGIHPTAGLELQLDSLRGRLRLLGCLPGTPAARISRWRSRLRFAYILSVNAIQILTLTDFEQTIATLRSTKSTTCDVCLTFDEIRNNLSASGLPQLYFDQLRDIRHINDSLRHPSQSNTVIPSAHRLTRKSLQTQSDWTEWLASECEQLNQYDKQGMFGQPCIPPPGAAIFHWVWIYKIKEEDNHRKKARAVCDGSTRGGHAQISGQTYAPTPDMTDLRLFFALAALENKLVFGADVSNAFAEAHAPAQVYFMRIDVQFREWWCSKGHLPIPQGFVVPILKNLQGHPEAPRQWSKHIDTILQQFHFIPTVHAPCLYRATFDGEDVLFLHQVDDFAIATNNEKLYTCLCDSLDATLLVPMKRQGLLTHYNGLDIIQARNFISVNCGSYVRKLLASHGWTDMHPVHLPMAADNAHIHSLDTAIPPSNTAECEALEAANFRYRGAVGELIWAMITCRPEISFPIIKLSQFSTQPAAAHYTAVKRIFKFLSGTLDYGLTYWRISPHATLPDHPPPPMLTNPADQHLFHNVSDATEHFSPYSLFGYADSDWAMDIRHRRSISGIIFKLAGAAIAWKCRVQPTVSLSSTEAEFLAASDAGKMALYLRSILDELHVKQIYATLLYEDNRGALLMAHAGQPTKQSRHIDIRHYALTDWVERDLIALEDVASGLNAADVVTKQTGGILFARHVDNITGRLPPPYVSSQSS